jgi:hypothetical protein
MNTYNWNIIALDCKINVNDLQNVIDAVHWRFSVDDGKGETAQVWGIQKLNTPDPSNFTSYDEITKEQVVSWLEASMNVRKLKKQLDDQLNIIIIPTNIVLPLPFEN